MANTLIVNFEANDQLTPKINELLKKLNKLDGRDITVDVKTSGNLSQTNSQLDKLAVKGGIAAGSTVLLGQMALQAGRQLLQFGKDSVKAASDVEEMQDMSTAVFKSMTNDVRAWAEETANATNRSKYALEEFAAGFQSFLVPMGLARSEAAEMSMKLTQLTVDLASFKNMSEEDVARKLRSGLAGSTEAVDDLGINLRAAALDQELMSRGFEKGARAASEEEKVVSRLNLMFKASGDAMGNAEKTKNSYENSTKGLAATINDLQIEIGKTLIPALKSMIPVLSDIVKKTTDGIVTFREFIQTSAGREALSALAGLAFGIGVVSVALKLLAQREKIAAFWAGVLQALQGPKGWVTLAIGIGAAASAYSIINKQLEKIADATQDAENASSDLGKENDSLSEGLKGLQSDLDDAEAELEEFKKKFEEATKAEKDLNKATDDLSNSLKEVSSGNFDKFNEALDNSDYVKAGDLIDQLGQKEKDYFELKIKNQIALKKSTMNLQRQEEDYKDAVEENKRAEKRADEDLVLSRAKNAIAYSRLIEDNDKRQEEHKKTVEKLDKAYTKLTVDGLEHTIKAYDKLLKQTDKNKESLLDLEWAARKAFMSYYQKKTGYEMSDEGKRQIEEYDAYINLQKANKALADKKEEQIEIDKKLKSGQDEYNKSIEKMKTLAPDRVTTENGKTTLKSDDALEEMDRLTQMQQQMDDNRASKQDKILENERAEQDFLVEKLSLLLDIRRLDEDYIINKKQANKDLLRQEEDLSWAKFEHKIEIIEMQEAENNAWDDIQKIKTKQLELENEINQKLGERIDILSQLDKKNIQSSRLWKSEREYQTAEKDYQTALGRYTRKPTKENKKLLQEALDKLKKADEANVEAQRAWYKQNISNNSIDNRDKLVEEKQKEIEDVSKNLLENANKELIGKMAKDYENILDKIKQTNIRDNNSITDMIKKIAEFIRERPFISEERQKYLEDIQKKLVETRQINLDVPRVTEGQIEINKRVEEEINKKVERHRIFAGQTPEGQIQQRDVSNLPTYNIPYISPDRYRRQEQTQQRRQYLEEQMRRNWGITQNLPSGTPLYQDPQGNLMPAPRKKGNVMAEGLRKARSGEGIVDKLNRLDQNIFGTTLEEVLGGENPYRENPPGVKSYPIIPIESSNVGPQSANPEPPIEIALYLDKGILTDAAGEIVQSTGGRTAVLRIMQDDRRRV